MCIRDSVCSVSQQHFLYFFPEPQPHLSLGFCFFGRRGGRVPAGAMAKGRTGRRPRGLQQQARVCRTGPSAPRRAQRRPSRWRAAAARGHSTTPRLPVAPPPPDHSVLRLRPLSPPPRQQHVRAPHTRAREEVMQTLHVYLGSTWKTSRAPLGHALGFTIPNTRHENQLGKDGIQQCLQNEDKP